MRVNYFDLGLCRGEEIGTMEDTVFPALGITDFVIHGFEACKESYDKVVVKYEGRDNIFIHHLAVGPGHGKMRLYHCVSHGEYVPSGNSLFASKNNVGDEYEEVECVVFTDWLDACVPDWRNSVNILRMNIEGAEWHVMNDLKDKGLLCCFKAYCGSKPGLDILKIGELKHHHDDYQKLLRDNDIQWHLFHDKVGSEGVQGFINFLRESL